MKAIWTKLDAEPSMYCRKIILTKQQGKAVKVKAELKMEATICYNQLRKEFKQKQRDERRRYGRSDAEVIAEIRAENSRSEAVEIKKKNKQLLKHFLGKRN